MRHRLPVDSGGDPPGRYIGQANATGFTKGNARRQGDGPQPVTGERVRQDIRRISRLRAVCKWRANGVFDAFNHDLCPAIQPGQCQAPMFETGQRIKARALVFQAMQHIWLSS